MRIGAWIGALTLIGAGAAQAESVSVLGPNSGGGKEIVGKVAAAVHGSTGVAEDSDDAIIVVLGNESLDKIANISRAKIVAGFVGYNAFLEKKNKRSIGVFSDPEPRQIADAIKNKTSFQTIGYISASIEKDGYLSLLQKEGIKLEIRPGTQENVFRSLSNLYETSEIDALFISNDRAVVNAGNAGLVLESAYRKRIPTISPIDALKTKGVVLTVAPTNDQIIEAIVEVVEKLKAGTPVKNEVFPNASIHENKRLAEIMGVYLGARE